MTPRIISAQQENVQYYTNPIYMVRQLWGCRQLIIQLSKRQILQQDKGSYLGLLWSFVTPLAMLAVYTFVFSVIFQVRWQTIGNNNRAEFALVLFAGLIAFNLFSESVLAAPKLVVSKPNYVRRVVFPLEVLSVSKVAAVWVQSLFSLVILLFSTLIILGKVSATIWLLPLAYLPLVLLSLGLSWFLASLGVFIRDIEPLLQIVMRMLFFLTPIFYPLTAVPEQLQLILRLNPLAAIVHYFRQVLLWGEQPHWTEWSVITVITAFSCQLGYIWFMRSKKAFADII